LKQKVDVSNYSYNIGSSAPPAGGVGGAAGYIPLQRGIDATTVALRRVDWAQVASLVTANACKKGLKYCKKWTVLMDDDGVYCRRPKYTPIYAAYENIGLMNFPLLGASPEAPEVRL
jgi:hypothetical protein